MHAIHAQDLGYEYGKLQFNLQDYTLLKIKKINQR
jgi:hypothetical protein